MALDDLAGIAVGALRFLYRLGTLCTTLGIFLIVVAIFKGPQDFGVIPVRLILAGFGIESVLFEGWKTRVAGVVLIAVSLLPTHLYLAAYNHLK
jgi:hypothetical protein